MPTANLANRTLFEGDGRTLLRGMKSDASGLIAAGQALDNGRDFHPTPGNVGKGSERQFDDPLYLELDHNAPRSDGGLNHISNRLLLYGPV